MTDVALWIAVGALIVALVYLQVRGVRALQELGVQPSRGVVALRMLNTALVIFAIGFMFWVWVR